jgi:RNA polymerase sigma-70 factor (ECF subfamily)
LTVHDAEGALTESPTPADLAREHWLPVFRFVLHLTGDNHLAEELTQEAFLKALEHRQQLQPGTTPRAWLFTIARNLVRDRHRRAGIVAMEPLVVDPATTPTANLLELADEATKLRRALATLPEVTRSVFLMRVEGELPFNEVAAALGLTSDAARWHMGQARAKLLDQMDD